MPFQPAPVAHLVDRENAREAGHHLPRTAARDAYHRSDFTCRGRRAGRQLPCNDGDAFGCDEAIGFGHVEPLKNPCYNRFDEKRHGRPQVMAPRRAPCGLSPHGSRPRHQLTLSALVAGLLRPGANTTAVEVFKTITVYHPLRNPSGGNRCRPRFLFCCPKMEGP